MIHLRLRTEYSFRRAYGKLTDVLEAVKDSPAAAITDDGCWGHVGWERECKAIGVKPIFGVEIAVVMDPWERKKQAACYTALLARNHNGLQEIYELVHRSHRDYFYYYPRIGYDDVDEILDAGNIYCLSGTNYDIGSMPEHEYFYLEVNPENPIWNKRVLSSGWKRVACAANNFVTPDDRDAYEVVAGRQRLTRTTLQHVPNEWELELEIEGLTKDEFIAAEKIAADCNVELQRAQMVTVDWPKSLAQLCLEGTENKPWLKEDWNIEYADRLKRELDLIIEKDFEDYFQLVADLVREAKKIMIVGPARGSAAGSLVCYLIGITDVDPIKHDLLFERFIDVTRKDLPDIDIDFQDTKRDEIIAYLGEKYGAERVGRIGNIMTYKAKSAIGDTARALDIPVWEVRDVSEAIIERSGGDARAQFCVQDAFETLDIGRKMLEKYPEMKIAGLIEGHAKTSGTHAAGLLVTQRPVSNFVATGRNDVCQVNKDDAEALGMLKIDVLGLKTLTVIAECLALVDKEYDWLLRYPLDDTEAFEIFNEERFSGIFQFEGYALQALTRQMKVRNFDDIAVITALARPGPLHCGAANDFAMRRIGRDPVTHLHPLVEPITRDTYGTIVYQEQVMRVSREVGNLGWDDVSMLRKAMSKSLGEEFFNKYWELFKSGAVGDHGMSEADARFIWDRMCTFGSWAFNKSHAVSYGLLSYWCAVLKAHHPLEFAAASLRNQSNEEKAVKMLREIVKMGYEFEPYDPVLSEENWEVKDGKLIGGLLNIKGIGKVTAASMVAARASGDPFSPAQAKKLVTGETPFDDIFGCERRWGAMYLNPEQFKIKSGKIWHIEDISEPGEYVFIGKLTEVNLRDLNEYQSLVKRGGRRIHRYNLFLNLVVEDDTGSIIIQVGRYNYPGLGKPIVEKGRVGDWFLFKGKINDEWRIVRINKLRWLDDPDKVVERVAKDGTISLETKV